MSEQSAVNPPLHIRRGMDVYNADQTAYLGQVVRVWHGGNLALSEDDRGASARETGSAPEIPDQNPKLQQEQGDAQSPTRLVGKQMLGEEQGPQPTIALGNQGPVNQSAGHEYATRARDPHDGVLMFAVRPGRYNPLGRKYYIPSGAVHTLSLERIIIDVAGTELPTRWRLRPSE